MWLLFTLLAAVFWGVGQIFIKKGLTAIPPLFNNVVASAMSTSLFIPYALIHGVNFEKVMDILPVTLLIAVLFLIYYYTIGHGQLSLTGTVIGTYPLVTVLLSLFFLQENLSVFQQIAIAIMILGTVCIGLPNKLSEFKQTKDFHWFWWALVSVVILGTADFLIKLEINQSDLHTYLFTYGLITFPIALLSILFDKKGRRLPAFSWKKYAPALSGIFIMTLGFFSFHLALENGMVSLVTPISSIYVAITAILAWLILKEKINKKHAFGIILSALGVVLIGIA